MQAPGPRSEACLGLDQGQESVVRWFRLCRLSTRRRAWGGQSKSFPPASTIANSSGSRSKPLPPGSATRSLPGRRHGRGRGADLGARRVRRSRRNRSRISGGDRQLRSGEECCTGEPPGRRWLLGEGAIGGGCSTVAARRSLLDGGCSAKGRSRLWVGVSPVWLAIFGGCQEVSTLLRTGVALSQGSCRVRVPVTDPCCCGGRASPTGSSAPPTRTRQRRVPRGSHQ